MSQKIRQEKILQILKDNGYATVQYLMNVLQYSSATINRDLNAMQTLKLVERTRGGVKLYKEKHSLPPLPLREFYKKSEKQRIAKEACRLINNGDTVFLSGSTTVMHMIPYLADKKDLTVITNSARMCCMLGELDLEVICLGGRMKYRPHVLLDEMTISNALRFRVDKTFFSVASISKDGLIGNNDRYLLYTIMMNNSEQSYLLTDKTKFVDKVKISLCDFSSLTGVITDFEFSEEIKNSYPGVRFIYAKDSIIKEKT